MNEIISIGEDRYEVIFVYPLQKFIDIDTKRILEFPKHTTCHCDTVLKSRQRDQVLVCRKILTAKYKNEENNVSNSLADSSKRS